MKVVYCSRHPKDDIAPEGAERVDFNTLLEVSDFVSVHTPLTEETRGRFNADAFKRMKSTAVFINTARGPIHDQEALHAALKTQQIFAAGLDVTQPEPMDVTDPLLSLPNCIVLPHIGSATIQTRRTMAAIAADNILLGLEGRPLRCSVTP